MCVTSRWRSGPWPGSDRCVRHVGSDSVVTLWKEEPGPEPESGPRPGLEFGPGPGSDGASGDSNLLFSGGTDHICGAALRAAATGFEFGFEFGFGPRSRGLAAGEDPVVKGTENPSEINPPPLPVLSFSSRAPEQLSGSSVERGGPVQPQWFDSWLSVKLLQAHSLCLCQCESQWLGFWLTLSGSESVIRDQWSPDLLFIHSL